MEKESAGGLPLHRFSGLASRSIPEGPEGGPASPGERIARTVCQPDWAQVEGMRRNKTRLTRETQS
jgi:hypothetical protein